MTARNPPKLYQVTFRVTELHRVTIIAQNKADAIRRVRAGERTRNDAVSASTDTYRAEER